MNDMKQAIIPKSDQLNADDLLSGPITIKITGVTVRGGQEQPVAISYEGDNGKPYKACKSMCRVLVSAWGADSSKYVGRSLTLYCDPRVKWGGMEVGGLRISHMSDIDSAITMALTVTRANKKPFTVKPLKGTAAAQSSTAEPSAAPSQEGVGQGEIAPAAATNGFISPEQIREIETLCEMKGLKMRLSAKLAASKIASVDKIPVGKFDGIIAWADAQK